MGSATEFYRSQVGGTSVINYGYTDFPLRLLAWDIYYFFVYIRALPWILYPLFDYGSEELDELYPTASNLFCVVVHVVLALLQLAFLVALPLAILLPLWIVVPAVLGFSLVNWLLCKLLNGSTFTFHSDEKYAKALPEHAHEQWVFVNGVLAGEHWLRNNLNRLALTFKRPILGIHNQTSGILFDVIECLIQRNLSYATSDVRITYKVLKDVLYDPTKTKVILVLHSQGGIEGGMVLDWLLQEIPQDLLAKLEVYTFGNAANHFNNPHRHVVSQTLTASKPIVALNTLIEEVTLSPVEDGPSSPALTNGEISTASPMLPRELSSLTNSSTVSSHASAAANDRAIGHVEHYAHTSDFVAMWGVLHFATNKMSSPQLPRFLGRLFVRSKGRGGHQFVQFYLDSMFPLKRDPESGEFVGADEDNEFMEEVVRSGTEEVAMEDSREAFDITYQGTQGFGSADVAAPVEVHGASRCYRRMNKDVKVKDLSRLWSYRNGRSPAQPPSLVTTQTTVPRSSSIESRN